MLFKTLSSTVLLLLSSVDAQRPVFQTSVKSSTSSAGRPVFATTVSKSSSSAIKTASSSTTSKATTSSSASLSKTTSSSTSTRTTSSSSTSLIKAAFSSTTSRATSSSTSLTKTTHSSTSSTAATSSSTSARPTTTSAPALTAKPSTSSSSSTTPTTSTTSSAAACSTSITGYGCLPLTNQAAFVKSMLDQHNLYRARHNAAPLTWAADLVPSALANAQNNADNNLFVHTQNNPNGENIAYQYGYNNPQYLGWLWYDEWRLFDFNNGGFSEATGHFTQVVWLETTQIGCAYVQAKNSLSNNGYLYLSCEYRSPGNYVGEYRQNVVAPNSQPAPTQPPQRI